MIRPDTGIPWSSPDAEYYAMLQRNLLYIGVTRGKRLGRPGGPEEDDGHRGAQRVGVPPVVEAGRTARRREA